jgi:hypothetical protein
MAGLQASKPHTITITLDGKKYFGRYRVECGLVTVTTLHGRKSAQVGASAAEVIARWLLSELVAEGKADD